MGTYTNRTKQKVRIVFAVTAFAEFFFFFFFFFLPGESFALLLPAQDWRPADAGSRTFNPNF